MVEESTHEGPASTMLVVAFLPLPCIQTHLTEVTDIMGAYQSASDELEPFEHFVFASEERLRQGRPSLQANNTCFGWHKQVRMADCRTREETSEGVRLVVGKVYGKEKCGRLHIRSLERGSKFVFGPSQVTCNKDSQETSSASRSSSGMLRVMLPLSSGPG